MWHKIHNSLTTTILDEISYLLFVLTLPYEYKKGIPQLLEQAFTLRYIQTSLAVFDKRQTKDKDAQLLRPSQYSDVMSVQSTINGLYIIKMYIYGNLYELLLI
jgi:hypothetical protein